MKASTKSLALWTLVVVNATLLTVLVMKHSQPNLAMAQNARPGDYLTIPANLPAAAPNGLIYVLDTTNRKLGGLSYDINGHRLQSIPVIDLDGIFQNGGGVVPGAPVRPGVRPR